MVIAMNADEIREKLQELSRPHLVNLVHNLRLRDEYMSNVINVATSIVADEICKQAKLIYGPAWESKVALALVEVVTGARNYFEEKLGHIKDFLIEPPEEFNASPEHQGTVKELREALKKRDKLVDPALIKVRGTLFPAALLTSGWWERTQSQGFDIKWRNTLQRWLFDGFDQWAPSWDISWDLEGREQDVKPYYIAQLAGGDEADSLAVVFGPKRAKQWRDKFIKSWTKTRWCGFEVEVTGVLGHKRQAKKELRGIETLEGFSPRQANDYCIWLKDDDNRHDIVEVGDTELYSGYLWKCFVPRQWVEERDSIGLGDVYIIWEHTNFAASDALTYNLASLNDKELFIKKQHSKQGGLILLQKSHELIIPGDDPKWRVDDFYRLLVAREKIKVSDELLKEARSRPRTEG